MNIVYSDSKTDLKLRCDCCIRFQQFKGNVKFTPYRPPRAKRGSRGIALLFLELGARRGWVFSTTPRLL
jgi:hypothetical protein